MSVRSFLAKALLRLMDESNWASVASSGLSGVKFWRRAAASLSLSLTRSSVLALTSYIRFCRMKRTRPSRRGLNHAILGIAVLDFTVTTQRARDLSNTCSSACAGEHEQPTSEAFESSERSRL